MMQQKERLEKQLDFIREIDKEKEIFQAARKTMRNMPGIWLS